ncbi:ORF25 [Fowl aviadenovirus D]|nr:ORF25 [Fowl aviadenovirus D]
MMNAGTSQQQQVSCLTLLLCVIIPRADPLPITPASKPATDSARTGASVITTHLPASPSATPCDEILSEDCWFENASGDYQPLPWESKEETVSDQNPLTATDPIGDRIPAIIQSQSRASNRPTSKEHTSTIASISTVVGIAVLVILTLVAYFTKYPKPRPPRSIYIGVAPPDMELKEI